MSSAGSLWKLPCDPFPLFFCILREAAHAYRSPRASGRGMCAAAPALPAQCLKSLSSWKIPLLSCSGALGFSFSLLVWDLLSPELGFVTFQQQMPWKGCIYGTREEHAMWAGGTELISHTLRGQLCPCCGGSKVYSGLFGLCKALVQQCWRKLLFFFTKEQCALSGWGPMAHLMLGIAPGEEKSRLFLCRVTSAPTWKLNVATACSAGNAENL